MAHKKSGGAKAKQGSKSEGKPLGVKLYGGQKVSPGEIIVRQRGSLFHAGDGVKTGRDFTLFAVKEGFVSMKKRLGRKFVEVKREKG
ncbi:50S ribosomal protein L27 [Patescibacteria group bacterium]|nr:50S ribosomal protein L27 [Patescibacteria group bacterium]